jgi:hypothetical protein
MADPKTRQQVDYMIDDAFPTSTSHTTWIERDEPRRHVAVRFKGGANVEGAGSTWEAAIADVRRQRRSR